jgi:GTP-binding protein LepA
MQDHKTDYIRNFCVIAHIDHGKSTLCDRFLEITHTIEKRNMEAQFLDSNSIERERGITIKLAPVRMIYKSTKFEARNSKQILNSNDKNSNLFINSNFENSKIVSDFEFGISNLDSKYILNLIDTPGHIDFSYEVSRSLAACEGAVLVVDATQGVEAQTISNTLSALKQGLVIIPVINKIDLPNANIEKTKEEIKNIFGFVENEILYISAKTGEGCENVLLEVIKRIPPPATHAKVSVIRENPLEIRENPRANKQLPNINNNSEDKSLLRALIFNSYYDTFKGVVIAIKVIDGEFNMSDFKDKNTLKFLGTKGECVPIECGFFKPKMVESEKIMTGEVGYVATGLKDLKMCRIGDTISTSWETEALPGYSEIKHFVFAGIYPMDQEGFLPLKVALEKLQLTDSSLSAKPITSKSLGNGFHVGFLGLLHADIVKERLLKEFKSEVIMATPTVEYEVLLTSGEKISVDNPINFPDVSQIEAVYEPIVEVSIFTPKSYIGDILKINEDGRGKMITMDYFEDTVDIKYKIPYQEIITDYYDKLKSVSSGYASLSYDFIGFEEADIVKVDVLLNTQVVDALSFMVERSKATFQSRNIIEKLRAVIPRQQYAVAIQAAIGGKIIARGDVNPFRKDVLKKMSGGDRSRKDKLLEAQKKGKKRMKQIGNVEVPQSAFAEVFKI